jgi:hypothetical protein
MKNEAQALSHVPTISPGTSAKVLRIGLIAGTLDIADALIFNQLRGIHPTIVLQYIASGLIGRVAFLEGASAATLGLLIHYVVAVGWTLFYYALSRRLSFMNKNPVICGLLFGAMVYLVMNFVVLPLSAVARTANTQTPAALLNGVLAVLICIGLTISLLVSRSFKAQRQQ